MDQRRRGMTIGESLAQARRQAGLSINQVSQQTRIRETIISSIERGDFSACGGDFYSRGHIRSIARAVGTDPEPLVREYDATVGSAQPTTAADLLRPVMPIKVHEPRRSPLAAAAGLALAVVIGFAAYHLISGPDRAASAAKPAAAVRTSSAARHRPTHRAPHPAQTASPYAGKVVIRLTAIQNCWVGFTTPGGAYLSQSYVAGGTSKSWTFGYPVDMRLGNPGGISLTVDGKNPLRPGTANPITLSLGLNGNVSG
jgi:cytoskeletal protein RodZ